MFEAELGVVEEFLALVVGIDRGNGETRVVGGGFDLGACCVVRVAGGRQGAAKAIKGEGGGLIVAIDHAGEAAHGIALVLFDHIDELGRA